MTYKQGKTLMAITLSRQKKAQFCYVSWAGILPSLLFNYIEIFFVLTWHKFLFVVKLRNAADQVWKTKGCTK